MSTSTQPQMRSAFNFIFPGNQSEIEKIFQMIASYKGNSDFSFSCTFSRLHFLKEKKKVCPFIKIQKSSEEEKKKKHVNRCSSCRFIRRNHKHNNRFTFISQTFIIFIQENNRRRPQRRRL